MLRRALLGLAICATPAFAQEDRDPGFLAGLIEDNISAPGLSVQIDGFQGALSSRASIDELRIADDAGTWLVARDLVLDWDRGALFDGSLQVDALTAGLIRIDRAPLPPEGITPPPAAARGFSLPNLPVAIDIQRLAATRIELGAPLLGQAAALTLEASAQLANGSGETEIEARRVDGPAGVFSIAASYRAGETPSLTLDLNLREAQGGLATTLLALPGAPALELSISGDGPVDLFGADIRLASDGQQRLGGRVTLTGTEAGQAFAANVSGDVTALFAPRYRPFFGDDVALIARGVRGADGGLVLDALDLRTQAMSLGGRARIGADGWPLLLDLEGELASPDGEPVLLPLPDPVTVSRAAFDLRHDPSQSDDWSLSITANDLIHPTLAIESSSLDGRGLLARQGTDVTAANATIEGDLSGLVFSDPALAQAFGRDATLRATIDWSDDTPLELTALQVDAAGLSLNGSAALLDSSDPAAGVPLSLDLAIDAEDLSRFALLAATDLGGAAAFGTTGTLDPLAGTFDLRLNGQTVSLALGVAQLDPLIAGTTDLGLNARRSLQGTFIEGLRLGNDQVSLTADATIYGEETDARARGLTGEAVLDARLSDGSPLDPRLAGPVTLASAIRQAEDRTWSGTLAATAPHGVRLDVEGLLTGEAPDVSFDLSVPDVSAFADGIPGAARLQGRASAKDAIWSIESQAALPWDLTARLSGPVTGPAPRLEFEAALPDLSAPVPAFAGVPPLNTGARLQGVLAQNAGVWSVASQVQTGTGIEARVAGPVTGAPDIGFTARVPRIEAFSPALEGRPALAGAGTLSGSVRQERSAWIVDSALETDRGIRATAKGPLTGDMPEIAFTARVPDLAELDPALKTVAALRGQADLSGTLRQTDDVWGIDADILAPSDISGRVLGSLTGASAPDLALAATVPDLQVFVPALTGLLSLDATLRQLPDGLTLKSRINGPLDARARIETVLAGPLVADFALVVPDLSSLAPVRGGLDITGQAQQVEGGFDVSLSGTGPYEALFDASLSTVAGLSIETEGQIPDASRVVPQLRGPIDFDISSRQQDAAWFVDAEVEGAQSISARVQGVATGPEANLAYQARIGSVAPFAPGLSGPLSASGQLVAQGSGYGFDLTASGPLSSDLTATGTITNGAPTAQFDLRVPDIGPLVSDLSGPLRATGRASQQGERFAVDVDLTGPGGTTARVDGLAGGTLDLNIAGQAPLGLANAFIAPNRLSGSADFDLQANGPPGLQALSGTATISGAALSLPALRNGLNDIGATIMLSGAQAQIGLEATPTSGGVVRVTGPVGLTAPFNSNLAIRFDGRLEDPTLYTARVITELQLAGPLAGGASISGDILLDEAEVTVPSSGLTAVGALPPIQHVGAGSEVQRTLARAGQSGDAASSGTGAGAQAGPAFPLNITVRAPNRIFVRGRGMDAELGGELAVRGTSRTPIVAGGFELVRGRLDILQQRFQLDQGTITFQGSTIPYINLVAETETDALTAAIIVEGPATAPEVRFESSPSVPQEEILAQIFFGRDLDSLSALQALQLANSVAVLAGRGNGGLLERLRGGAGLDDLDLTTDAEGNTAIRAGKYISDNVYTDVQIGSDGNPRVTLNIDVTPNLTVRGGAGASGDTSIGLFFEKDY